MEQAKRIIKQFDFTVEGAHVALVDSAANEQTVLVMKAKEEATVNPFLIEQEDTVIKKALEQVEIKLSMEQFLRKFFDMWSDDAELLTKLLGFETEWEAAQKENGEAYSHQDWVEERVKSFSIMKSLNSGELNEITISDYINIVKLQDAFESNLNKSKKEEEMTTENVEETIEVKKAEIADLRKALDEFKAQNAILMKEREETIEKALTSKVAEYSFVEKQAELVALVKQMDSEAQDLVFEILNKAKAAVEASAEVLSVEGEEEVIAKSTNEEAKEKTAELIKAKYQLSDK